MSRDNPFEEPSLPKAYYFPSLEKSLSTNERKTCLNPDKMVECPKETRSKEDAKFLRGSNKLLTHEVPTREDGTVKHDTSSGSQFNESWPSTDRNVSSLSSGHSPSLSGTPRPASSMQETSKNCPAEISSSSTLSKYVERFRHGAPASREQRQRATDGADFWWLSPPSSSSTPKEPTEESTLTSRLYQSNSTQGSEKAKKVKKTETKSGSAQALHPVREMVEGIDSDMADLQTRTDLLLEKSESTLSNISTPESTPKHPSSWMLSKQKRLEVKNEPKNLVSRPRPPPEDDILYQWRLSRRLETAQEHAKTGWTKHSLSSLHRRNVTDPIQTRFHRREVNGHGLSHSCEEVVHDIRNSTKRHEISAESGKNVKNDRTTENVTVEKAERKRVLSEKECKACVDRKVSILDENVVPKEPLASSVPGVCFITDANLPSHVHMMCDIVPCSQHKNFLRPKDVLENGIAVSKQLSTGVPSRECAVDVSPPATIIKNASRRDSVTDQDEPPPLSTINATSASPATGIPMTEKYTPMPVQLRDAHQETYFKMTDKSEQETGKSNVIGAVIGQVISERLFSSTLSSHRSSMGSDHSTDSPYEEEEKTNLAGQEQADVKTETKVPAERGQQSQSTIDNTSLFVNDDILRRLHQQANFYKEHLRNIDRLLEQMAD